MAFRLPLFARVLLPVALLLAVACAEPPAGSPAGSPRSIAGTPATRDTSRTASAMPDSTDDGEAGRVRVARQTIYVPVYSHIYTRDQKRVVNLTATLSVRNTDLHYGLRVTSVRYYDSDGALVRSYLDAPLDLGPLASTDFIVEELDRSGGLGANFIVEWSAPSAVTAPVVEAVMISTASSQGISFVSVGRVIAEQGA
jgi:hypothetical protein